jgi:hypothetical protein
MQLSQARTVALLCVIITGCWNGDASVSEYPTRAAADADGAFARGWLPATLPPGSTEIQEAHDMDTNERWLSFRAPVPELRALATSLTPLSYGSVRAVGPRAPRWTGIAWPQELNSGFQHTPREGVSYFRDTNDAYCYAVEWESGRAWGWSCRTPDPSAA